MVEGAVVKAMRNLYVVLSMPDAAAETGAYMAFTR